MDETPKLIVYRFMVFDGEMGRYVQAPGWATLDRIQADSNYVVRGSGVLIDRSQVGLDGMTSPDFEPPTAKSACP